MNGYHITCIKATKLKNVKRGRHSGGVAILIKQEIRKYVKVVLVCNYGIWVKIDGKTINSDKDSYFPGIYLPPSDSLYSLKDPFDHIEKIFLIS